MTQDHHDKSELFDCTLNVIKCFRQAPLVAMIHTISMKDSPNILYASKLKLRPNLKKKVKSQKTYQQKHVP